MGSRIDVVVKGDGGQIYYEIKTALSARACIREALAQLTEYAYWPGSEEPSILVAVGASTLDEESAAYLHRLRRDFSLPIFYQQLNVEARRLTPDALPGTTSISRREQSPSSGFPEV